MKTKYGNFSKDGKEFIVSRPDTPAPWVNYITNGRHTGLISNTAGGYSFYLSPKDSRLTRWRYNSLPMDRPGRYIYIKEGKTYWSPTWQPTLTDLDSYECAHGLGYTRISSEYRKLESSITYFVPLDDDLEVWWVTLSNNSKKNRKLDIFASVELCLGHALVDLINQPNDQHFTRVHFDKETSAVMGTKDYWVTYGGATVKQQNKAWNRYLFLAGTLPVKSFDGHLHTFIGKYHSEANPLAVEKGSCFNTEITAGDGIAALQNTIQLKPGQKKSFAFFLGSVPRENSRTHVKRILKKYRSQSFIRQEFNKIKADYDNYLSYYQVDTPNKDFNLAVNVWNQYQTRMTFANSRNASYYHGGLLFGRGMRDSCQDLVSTLLPQPELARERILEMAGKQDPEGSMLHCYFPLGGGGERTGHSDTPLWLPLAVTTYLKETAEFDILMEEIAYLDGSSGVLLEHVLRAIDYPLSQLSPRGLPKINSGDWNDTLDYLGRGGKGETVWGAMFLGFVLNELTELLEYIGEDKEALHYKKEYNKLKRNINKYCWDGNWYIRATKDSGESIGSKKNRKQGMIFSEPQSWAILSGIADQEKSEKILRSVNKYLSTPFGPKICHPSYTEVDPEIGLISRCVPGKKENGAVFNHPAAWIICAAAEYGNVEMAWDIYEKMIKTRLNFNPDRYMMEPYVYSEYVTSPDHPTAGQASHSWLTGSSAWMLIASWHYLMGVQATYDGLKISPRIPKNWKEYKVKRKFRDAIYQITIKNPHSRSKGKIKLKIDGKEISGDTIPHSNRKNVDVIAIIE